MNTDELATLFNQAVGMNGGGDVIIRVGHTEFSVGAVKVRRGAVIFEAGPETNPEQVARLPDHWAILGIEPTEDPAKVRDAFNRKAAKMKQPEGGMNEELAALIDAKNKALEGLGL